MKEKILLAGASGALGLELARFLKKEDTPMRALVHSPEGVSKIAPYTSDVWQLDASKGFSEIRSITKNTPIVISSMGKSVSLFTDHGNSFLENDFLANSNLIRDAVENKVKRFIYISIKGADFASEYEVARVHRKVEESLKESGLDYTIIRPVGFFSGLNDLAIMAKRKLIPVVGTGEARTNSIHQKDLAALVLQYLENGPEVIEVGGPLIHSRMEMAEMIKERIGGKIITVPEKIADFGTVLPEIISDDISSKLKYFKYITSHDMIGEKTGSITFKEYLNNLDLKDLP